MVASDGSIYDLYFSACREGNVEEPEAFFARHADASDELRSRIELLHRRLTEKNEVPFERLGEFRLLGPLDEGGMGTVYLAEQDGLDRVVALKIIRPELQSSRTAALRFEREAQALAQLRNPHLVTIHGAGTDQGVSYLAMEVVPGRGLDDLISGEALPWRRVVSWMAKLARALAYAHAQGIVHRDVKPSNIRVTPDDEPLLIDFGIAYDMAAEQTALTRTFAGSPTYAAPEQIDPRGGTADGRTDVYGLGVTLYQCLTGELPFAAETVERIFQRTLTEDAKPPRAVNKSVPRDLDVVTLKAMEKDPARRYQTADDLAKDLEALLAHRPIAARPPGPVRRLAKWSRRHPAWASATALLLVVAIVAGIRSLQAAAERRAEARRLVSQARDAIAGYRDRRDHVIESRRDVSKLRNRVFRKHSTEQEDDDYDTKERAVSSEKRLREETFHTVHALLGEAQRLDPDVPGVDDVRAELYFERWEEARSERNVESRDFYRDLVRKTAPGSRFAEEVLAKGTISVKTEPDGADVFLYRYEEPEEERRLVPVPYRGRTMPAPPGAWALRVVHGAGGPGGPAPGDHILDVAGSPVRDTVFGIDPDGSIMRFVSANGRPVRRAVDVYEAKTAEAEWNDMPVRIADLRGIEVLSPARLAERGGVKARVEHRGAVKEVTLPKGLVLRATAAPAFLVSAAHAGRTPIHELPLEAGHYLVVVRKAGYETLRFAADSRRNWDERWGPIRLDPLETTPPGWVYIPAEDNAVGGFWIMEREVTVGEYLQYLNEKETLARIDASTRPILAPRGAGLEHGQTSYLDRGKDGRYRLKDEWRPDWPMIGVSYNDARSYVAWKSKRDGRTYELPARDDWNRAWSSFVDRNYPFGNHFRAKFMCSCYSRHRPIIEPVMTYPIDESPNGVYDMSGGAREWLETWWDKHRGLMALGGGAWGLTEPIDFTSQPIGFPPTTSSGSFGFRMIFRRKEKE